MIELKEADNIEIVTLMDNYTDALIPSSPRVKRSPPYKNGKIASPLIAEHGLSLLVRILANGKAHSILLDAGCSKSGVLHNLKELTIDINEIEAIILSHGHMDHYGALKSILRLKTGNTPVIVHPDVFLKNRFLVLSNGKKIQFPVLEKGSLKKTRAHIIINAAPYLLASGLALVTGEVERTTDFEKGMLSAFVKRGGKTEKDQILDDQAVVLNLKGKGLVIITGCAHSGIINTVRYAQKVTGIDQVYAVIGGFHLSGMAFEPNIAQTIKELKVFKPALISPMHCTGWKAMIAIARERPWHFVLSTVGTTLTL
jgi:7,8-dihydropterin-6-yl-methyl-4-(beta-D-ribofuranosyl)aminobenzene 5'-phosphate synthase